MLAPSKRGCDGGFAGMVAITLDLEDKDKQALPPSLIDTGDSEVVRGRVRLNLRSLKLLSRILRNQRTTFYYMSRQIKLNI